MTITPRSPLHVLAVAGLMTHPVAAQSPRPIRAAPHGPGAGASEGARAGRQWMLSARLDLKRRRAARLAAV